MKTLSMKQPWGYLVAEGIKTIETRKWRTNYRGDILFTASKITDFNFWDVVNSSALLKIEHVLEGLNNSQLGVALCLAELYKIKPMTKEDEEAACCEVYDGAYSWFLRNIRKVKPVPIKGKLSLFDVDDKIIELIQ